MTNHAPRYYEFGVDKPIKIDQSNMSELTETGFLKIQIRITYATVLF